MKRQICSLLLLALLLGGCGNFAQMKEPVSFYYVRQDYSSDMLEVLDSELWEAAGHRDDLHYLLALYFMGPSREDLISPLPPDARLISLEQSDSCITLNLTELSMSDADYTLACACLARTLLGITDAQQITIISASKNVTLYKDNLALCDTSGLTKEEP